MHLDQLVHPNFDTASLVRISAASDPLRHAEVLVECYPVKSRVDFVRRRASILLDCRYCADVNGNSAVLLLERLSNFSWQRDALQPFGEITITSWKPKYQSDWSVVAALGWSGAEQLAMSASSVLFIAGDIAGLDDAPPNFGSDSYQVVEAGLPNYDVDFEPTGFSDFKQA